MKTAPCDIFIYGVHKSTEVADIIEDLAASEIEVKQEDIVKKTRENATVDCYKITVKAEDLEKALRPETWPLRVKAREWIYYPSKRQGRGPAGSGSQPPPAEQFGQHRHASQQQPATQPGGQPPVVGQQLDNPAIVLQNRFDVLGGNTA